MIVRVCPKCGKHNLEKAWHCADCGETLSLKTLTDTDSGRLLSATPIAGHGTLSEISANFEQDVLETLRTTVRRDESILWGCNWLGLSEASPFFFGYLIVTSRQLVRVQFASDTKKAKKSSAIQLLLSPMAYLMKEMSGVYEESTHPWTAVGARVPYPSNPLTPAERNSRRVMANELRHLAAASLIPGWYGELLISSLAFRFEESGESVITFYSPHQAEKTYQALIARLDETPLPR
jgi:hypothetical protein